MQDKRLLITGGTSGIGAATARLALERGARVHVLDVASMTFEHPRLTSSRVDISDLDSVRTATEKAADALGGFDGLANVAGISVRAGKLENTDFGLWRRTLEINLMGALHVAECALPALRQREGASIVNVASGVALRPFAGTSAYAASKSALITLSKVWAMELGPTIRVNVVCPGPIETPMLSIRGERKLDPDLYALRRLGQADEIARTVLFLLSDEASYITGSVITADGGRAYH